MLVEVAVLVAHPQRLMGMALRRLTVAQEAQQAPMERLALKAA